MTELIGLFSDHVVWISVLLLVGLFLFQRFGTSKVSFLFSPIMLVWFATNVLIGVYNIIKYHPSILKAVSPHYALRFFLVNGNTAWDLLGAVFLSITGISLSLSLSVKKNDELYLIYIYIGAEAMFADLGHFNKRAIQVEGKQAAAYPML